MWARVDGGVVAELTAVDPAGRFHPDLIWVSCPADVRQGWSYDGTNFAPPPPPPAPTLAQLAAVALAAGLSITSTATPVLDGTYACDPATIAYINAELASIMLNGVFADGTSTVEWPDAGGTPHSFTVAQFKTFATALGVFVAGVRKCVIGLPGATVPATTATIA